MNQATGAAPQIRRTRVACKACHERRVKCDAADGIPCMHCRTRVTGCELIESRRGRYTRQKLRKTRCKPAPDGSASTTTSHHGPETLSSITADTASDASNAFTQTYINAQIEPTYQEEVADNRPSQPGNSLTLSSIIQMARRVKETDSSQMPTSLTDTVNLQPDPELGDTPSLQDALVMPEREVSDQLIRSFFSNFHPAYPVIDRTSFTDLYKKGSASPILLHTVYMVSFTCGHESLVQIAGFSARTSARKKHYLCAKTLYDAGHEKDATSLVAALHLLSFWWLGPSDQKDSWYWQGCSVTLAQTLGMHRSLAKRGLSPRLVSIWKRIWWSIYVRDRHAAAALGRPCRIRDEDCDIEPVNENDLLIDLTSDRELLPVQEPCHIHYFLEITRLSAILGNIVIGEFSPHRPALVTFDATTSFQSLESWHSGLPQILVNNSSDKPNNASFWASMLDTSYQNACILLFRPKPAGSQTFTETERDMQARKAADAITRTAEDLLATDIIHNAQLHLVPSLFGALSIHTLVISQKNTVQRQLAENKSRQCILALSELAKHWPVGMWLVKSFSNLVRRLLSQGSTSTRDHQQDISFVNRVNNSNDLIRTDHKPEESSATCASHIEPEISSSRRLFNNLFEEEHDSSFQAYAYPDFLETVGEIGYDSNWLGSLENMIDMELVQKELGIGS